jgi:ABC-2 type transport system permease protein
MLEAAGNGTMLEQYVAMLYSVMAMIAAVPVVLTVLRLRSEETHGRLEQVLARPVKRSSLFAAFGDIAFAESFVVLIAFALGLASASGGAIGVGESVKAALVYLPAVYLMAALAMALLGALPKLTPLIWVLFAYSFVTVYFGKLINLPDWMAKLSPFGSIPQLPVQELEILPLALMIALSAVLCALGLWRYRERNIG